GTRQGIKPAHLVAAITSVSGHPNDSLGKIHIRELMSSVEVPVEGIENWIDDFRKETINGHSFKLSFDPMLDIDVKLKKKPKEPKKEKPSGQEKKKTSPVKKEKKDKKEPKSKFPSKPRRGQGRNNNTQPKRRRK
ncbi:MAG: DbpA RNA binding domain-containing protein, partial [Erysipelotrichaceae bacterium]|nr:DbpA RNA binding domain-containing protein [Erysipelotrichaceae bacterium]